MAARQLATTCWSACVSGGGGEVVSGFPGDGINASLAAWGRAENEPKFGHSRHEEMSAFEAVGYAKFNGVVRGIEAVGYQAHDHTGEERPALVLDNLVRAVRTTGGIGVVGVYVPEDPQAATEGAKEGRIGFDFGGGSISAPGKCPVKRYNEQLRDLIIAGTPRRPCWCPMSWPWPMPRRATRSSISEPTIHQGAPAPGWRVTHRGLPQLALPVRN